MHEYKHLTACPLCDTLHRRPQLALGQVAHCRVCGGPLGRFSRLDRRRMIPLVLACLLMFVIANVFPIVSLEMQGTAIPLTLSGAVLTLLDGGLIPVALMVFLPTLLLPGLFLLLLLGVLLLSSLPGIPDRVVNRTVRMMQQLYPWSMIEVFLLGVLVAIIKLSGMASVIPGPALWGWMGTTITLTVVLTFNVRQLVRRRMPVTADRVPDCGLPTGTGGHLPTTHALCCGGALGMLACHHCDTVWADARPGQPCRHCGAPLRRRKRGGLGVTWALLVTAIILYLPANLLPVMSTSTLFGESQDTILSGVVYFWASGEWALAAIIFIASFLIPLFKLGGMVLLVILTQWGSLWRLAERTRLYEVIEWVGRWSMLDVFVVAVTSSLVQMPGVAVIQSGPGIAAFGAVVVLTMLATMSFDPRLAWDARFHRRQASAAGAGACRPVQHPLKRAAQPAPGAVASARLAGQPVGQMPGEQDEGAGLRG
ncbi:MAG: paraquat-inducible protein A [Lautropia sp.]|nr:paraquat-inducible protein A [Lautropia sp.]